MRAYHRSILVILAGLTFVAASGAITVSAQPKQPAAPAGGSGSDGEIEIDPPATGSGSAAAEGEIDMGADEPQPPTDLGADMAAADAANSAVKTGPVRKTPLSWEDIVVVIRKPFLKQRRTELYPFVGTTMNDNMVRHYTVGGELAYYLTDVLAIGVEGLYYKRSFREPFDLVARQARRLPTVNEYKWSAALNFHYVPVYGKFAILDRKLVTWEVAFTAGIGAGQSEVIPRNTSFPGFSNFLIMPNVGANMRFFLAKWLTINVGVRDYLFLDKFEPVNRDIGMNATAEQAKENADSQLINNVMFQIGVSFWLPTSFEYTTFR
ncbi:MAG: outer membrane beta-barrel domain-containing protein [Kofleriaceae bacterium]